MTIARSWTLSTIPPRKVKEAFEQTLLSCDKCLAEKSTLANACNRCRLFNDYLSRFSDSNIPVRYWKLQMDENFKGDKILLDKYNEIVSDLKAAYNNGVSLCFAGSHGLGKTMTCANILKMALAKGYSCLYVTLNDIVANTLNNNMEDKATARRELLMVDFLVIDEFDPRYMGSDNAADLFGRILEDIFRTRASNKLPTFMCTNSPNVVESFNGPIKQSISSLMNYVTKVSVLGKDFRKEGK